MEMGSNLFIICSEIIKEKTKTKKNVMEKNADDNIVMGGMNHLTKKGVQEVETYDDKDIAGGKGLKQRVRSTIISLFRQTYLCRLVCACKCALSLYV